MQRMRRSLQDKRRPYQTFQFEKHGNDGEKLYGPKMSNTVKTATTTDALFDALYPLFATFCKKKNQDKLVESFFALIRKSCDLLNCKDYKASNLIMIHIPDHLVGFYRTIRKENIAETETSEIKKILTQPSGVLVGILEKAKYLFQKQVSDSTQGTKKQSIFISDMNDNKNILPIMHAK